MPKSVTVVLVRLCECEGNVAQKIASHGQLIDLGRQQAQATRERLASLGIKAWFSADNSAWYETAQILANGSPVTKMGDFTDATFPGWKGKTFKELREQYAEEWASFLDPKPGTAHFILPSRGESLSETCARAMRGFQRLYEQHTDGDTIGIVTTGEVVRLLTLALLQAPLENMFRLRGKNGSVTIVQFDGTKVAFDAIGDWHHLIKVEPKDIRDYPATA